MTVKNILSILLMIGAASFVSCKPKAHANRAAATTDSAVYSIIKIFIPHTREIEALTAIP